MTKLQNMKKWELIKEIEFLRYQIKQQRDAMAPFRYAYGTLAPCGPAIDLYNHPFEDEIRNLVSEQYDGTTGWVPYQLFDFDSLPYQYIIAHVSYTEQDGTFVDKFIPATFLDSKYETQHMECADSQDREQGDAGQT